MSNKMIKSTLFCFVVFSIIITGCNTNPYEKNHYLLEAKRDSSTTNSSNQNIIEIRPFTIDSAFSLKTLTYRIAQNKYESDYYNQFLISPAAMITETTKNWLWASGIAQKIQSPGSYNEPTHIIEGNIVSLYGDYRDKSSPKAVMEIRFFLLRPKSFAEPEIVFGKLYQSRLAIESKSPIGLINALNQCLMDILKNLEMDLREELK